MPNFSNELITMDEKSHEYTHNGYPEISFTSVTTFIELFFEKFDGPAIAQRLCDTIPRYAGRDPEDVLQEWKEAAEFGTNVHAEIVEFIVTGKEPESVYARLAADWMKKNIPSENEIYPEIITCDIEHKIAGTADLLVLNKKTGTYHLYDWKTNKKMETKSFGGKTGIHPITAQLDDCSFIRYSLQLSLYKYLLEKAHTITISSMTILHINGISVEEYQARDFGGVVLEMLQYNRT